ncbi:MAG: hypothetical protein Salg2KO_17550 [Salibacteraceae bacterium]
MAQAPDKSAWKSTGRFTPQPAIEKSKSIVGTPAQDVWNTTLQKIKIYHGSPDSVDALKIAKRDLKASAEIGQGVDRESSRAVTPTVGTSMNGTSMTSSTPPDNTVAISNAGRIVAVDNEDISYFNQNGTFVSSSTHNSFFSGMTTSNSLFDPRVMYDSEEDRFVYVLLHGNNSNTSKIFVCFSKSNNPAVDGWEIYEFPGNPLNDFSWTDYPNIGLSEEELFITVNLFSNNNSFNEVVIFQIDKSDGYAGATINYGTWDDVEDFFGSRSFTVVPASNGQQGHYGNNMYLVSSRAGGGTSIFLYEITDDLDGNPSLDVVSISSNYDVAADANQAGSSSLVDVGDCRMENAIYVDGTVHAVHSSEYLNTAYSGVYYYRIPVADHTNSERAEFGQTGFDYTYPSIASYGLDPCDQSVMIGCLRSGSSIFPEMRVMNCDQDMNWSSSTQVFPGQGPISFIGSPERWGDYSAMQRKHNASSPEVWFAGCYPTTSNFWRTRIAEIKGAYEPAEVPDPSFYSSDSTAEQDAFIDFFDTSTGDPDNWLWTFEGGSPAASTNQHQTVYYPDTGKFDVKIVARKGNCGDSITIFDMIHITAPAANDTDTVDLGGGFIVYIIGGDTFQLWNNQLVPLQTEEITSTNNRVYPNPIQSTEMMYVDFELTSGALIDIEIYDITGRVVKNLHQDYTRAGVHRIGFNKLALPSGNYVLRIRTNNQILLDEKIIVQR